MSETSKEIEIHTLTGSGATTQEKEAYRRLFEIAKSRLVGFSYAIWLIYEHKAWEALGYKNFEEACIDIFGINKSSASKYRTIAEGVLGVLGEETKFRENKIFEKIAETGEIEPHLTPEMRNLGRYLSELGSEKSYLLLSCPGVDIKPVIEGGNPVYLNEGFAKELTIDEIKKVRSVKQLVKQAEVVNELPAPAPKPKPANPLKDYLVNMERAAGFVEKGFELFREPVPAHIFDHPDAVKAREQYSARVREIGRKILEPAEHTESDSPDLKPGDFLPAGEIASILDITDKAVRKMCNEVIPRQYRLTKKKQWYIHPDGLPDKHRAAYYAELTRRAEQSESEKKLKEKRERELILNGLSKTRRRRALNLEYCIKQYAHLKGGECEAALAQHNDLHPDDAPVEYKTFRRHCRAYAKDGLKGIVDSRGAHRSGESKVSDDDFEYFKSAYLNQNQKSIQQCWEETFGNAKNQGRITISDKGESLQIDPDSGEITGAFPSAATFKYRLDKEVPQASQEYMRKGAYRFKQTKHFPHINLTHETVPPGHTYVMDHHTMDVLCKPSDKRVVADLLNRLKYHDLDPEVKKKDASTLRRILKSGLSSKKTVRLWLTNCMDFRTNKQLAWYLHEEAPNSDHVMYTFRKAVERYGYPEWLMMDNGKDFRCLDFAGNPLRGKDVYDEVYIHNLLSYLPTKPHFVLPGESQSKPIERQYQEVIDRFAKQFPTYTGPNPSKRPESCDQAVKRGDIPAAVDVIEQFDAFFENLNRKARSGKVLNGRSPDQVWDELHPGKRAAGQGALEMMTIRTSGAKQLTGNGLAIPFMGKHYFWADWMMGKSGTKVYAKWDPENWWECAVYDAKTDELLGIAELAEMPSGMAKTDEERKVLEREIELKKRHHKIIKAAGREIRKIAVGESLENTYARIEHENEVYERLHPLRQDGVTPSKLLHTELDKMRSDWKNWTPENDDKDISAIIPKRPEQGDSDTIYAFEADRPDE